MKGFIDAHLHATEELLPVLERNCVLCIVNSDNLYEYEWLRLKRKIFDSGNNTDTQSSYVIADKNIKIPYLWISAGIHPWKADVTDWEEMEPVLKEVKIIGEIGLDNVWCKVDMEIQRKVFLRQLEIASDLQKPVILHTKGMEKEVLEIIQQFPNRYLVHWYSGENYLEEYIKMGCWFTVGPAVLQDKAVEAVARKVPIERLLIESDGLDGISWGQNREIDVSGYGEVMEEHLRVVAKIRNCESEQLLEQMKRNLKAFFGICES